MRLSGDCPVRSISLAHRPAKLPPPIPTRKGDVLLTPSNLYALELAAFAKRAGVSPIPLAAGFGDPLHFADYFDFEELAKLALSYRPIHTPVRRDNLAQLLTTA